MGVLLINTHRFYHSLYPTCSLIPAQHRILWVNCVDLIWNAILASQAQRKDSVFEEMEEEDKQPSLSAIADPLLSFDATITETPGENDSVSIALVNDTAAPVVVDDLDVFGNQSGVFNTTSTKSTEAIAV